MQLLCIVNKNKKNYFLSFNFIKKGSFINEGLKTVPMMNWDCKYKTSKKR